MLGIDGVGAELLRLSDAFSSGFASFAAGPKYWDPAVANPTTAATTLSALAAGLTARGVAVALKKSAMPTETPYIAGPATYDPVAADRFYRERVPLIVRRLARLGWLTAGFNLKLLADWRLGNIEKNEKERAKEALALATQLGPTFIKLAQALSIRTDLIPEAYALELRQLQDAVPAFDSALAKQILARELGVADLSSAFARLSDEPLAAASIGQVYKGTLHDGRVVAVKVQRPGILGEIALDLYLLRLLAPLQTRISNMVNKAETFDDDLALAKKLVDEWGRGFVAEADYFHEARSTAAFSAAMTCRGLSAVTSPQVVPEYSTGKVLVTEWVDGTRLDLDASPDVPRLCAVAINAYLTMLLDTGVLHCDPHPGNLLRTRDGQLCILDWGMTLDVPSDLQYSLIEFIAHVNGEDFESMPQDFVNLGFTPPEQLERVKRTNLTEGLSFVLRQLSQGGGSKKMSARVLEEWRERYGADLDVEELRAKARAELQEKMSAQLASEGVDVSAVTNVMEEMQRRNREMFRVPPYILYVGRAFSTLEGIGLSANEDYSIVKEAFPYLSQRLLTDTSPRAKAALRSMLYGPRAASLDKLFEIGEGFTSYTSSTSSSSASVEGAQDQLIDVLLSADGGYVQELLLEEAAKLVDALVRDRIGQAVETPIAQQLANALRTPKRIADTITRPAISALPPVANLVDPLLAPARWLDELADIVPTLAAPSSDDKKALKSFDAVWQRFAPKVEESLSPPPDASNPLAAIRPPPGADALLEQLADPESRLRTKLPVVGTLSRRFGATLLRRVAARLEADGQEERLKPLTRRVSQAVIEPTRSAADLLEPKGEAQDRSPDEPSAADRVAARR